MKLSTENYINNRFKAFLAHLIISIFIMALMLVVIFSYWYPYDLIYAGGIDGLKILIGVDLVLGPLLTLLVFDILKPELKRDLSIIAGIQLTCLIGGLLLIHNERPVLQVLADDGLHLITASEIQQYGLALSDNPKLNNFSFFLLDLPEDKKNLYSLKFATAFMDEKPFSFRDDLYIPFNELSKDKYIARLDFIKQQSSLYIENEVIALKNENCDWVPLISKHTTGYVCITQTAGATKLSKKADIF